MKRIFVFLSLFLYFTLFSQIPIGKKILVGKNELKSILKKNGLNIINESKNLKNRCCREGKRFDHEYWELLYREEVKIWIEPDIYDNISEIYIFPIKDKNRSLLLKIFNYKDWEFLSTNNINGGKLYKYDRYYITLFQSINSEIGHISFTLDKPF